jgi:hypothetical protein
MTVERINETNTRTSTDCMITADGQLAQKKLFSAGETREKFSTTV